jgi:capsular polysaccharide biosynthesis protein
MQGVSSPGIWPTPVASLGSEAFSRGERVGLSHFRDAVRRHLMLVVVVTVVATVLTLIWVLPRPPIYQASSSFVVRPVADDDSARVRAFDTLIRGVSINATYATIARSDSVRLSAIERIGNPADAGDYVVSADIVTGTNVIQVVVTGEEPETVLALN